MKLSSLKATMKSVYFISLFILIGMNLVQAMEQIYHPHRLLRTNSNELQIAAVMAEGDFVALHRSIFHSLPSGITEEVLTNAYASIKKDQKLLEFITSVTSPAMHDWRTYQHPMLDQLYLILKDNQGNALVGSERLDTKTCQIACIKILENTFKMGWQRYALSRIAIYRNTSI